MDTNLSSPSSTPLAPVAPAKAKSRQTKTYFIPMLFYRHSTIVLCQHRHLNKTSAEKCLVKARLELKEILESTKLSRKARRQYKELVWLFVREVQLKKVYCLTAEIDHHQDRVVKQRNMLDMVDDYSPMYLHCLTDMPLMEMKQTVDAYHDQPKRPRRVVKHLTDVFPLKTPRCCQSRNKAKSPGKVGSL